jgi:hypothetical protein
MPIVPEIDSRKLRLVAARVKQVDPQIRTELIRGLKSLLQPYANDIAKDVPTLGQPKRVRGFGSHRGRTAWSPVKASVFVTPGGGKGSVARMEIFTSPNQAALKIADLAGTKGQYNNGNYSRGGYVPYLINGQGQDMVSALTDVARLSANGKGGRFVWAGFMKYRPMFLDRTVKAMNDYAAKVGQKLID